MPKLNQIIAIEDGEKKQEYADLTKTHHVLQKAAQFVGYYRTYKPRAEDGVPYPAEGQNVQLNAKELVKQVREQLASLFNTVATKDYGNTEAKADIIIDGEERPIAVNVPVTYLIFLEKKLIDLRTFIRKLPKLDPSKDWAYDANKGVWRTAPEDVLRHRKLTKPLVLHEGTKEHPPQTQAITTEEWEGTWTRVDISTAYPEDEIRAMEKRLSALEKAIKFARERANGIDVKRQETGKAVLDYIFG